MLSYFRAFAAMMTPEMTQMGADPDGAGSSTDSLQTYPIEKWLQAPNVTMLMWLGGGGAFSSGPSFFSANTDLIWLFQEILSTGGSIAFALQSMITVLSSMAFYDQIQQFDKSGEAQVSHFVTVNRPVRSTGLTMVLAALAMHLIFVAYIIAFFLSRTQYSMLGQTWHALSQTVSPDTQRVLDQASNKRDGQLEKQMRAEGKEPMVLRYVPDLGRAAVVRADVSTGGEDEEKHTRFLKRHKS